MPDAEPTTDTPDWETLDIELRCPRCRYDLRRLPQPRCPECGLQFRWAELVAATRCSLSPLAFEYQWRKRPLRSFLATVGRAMFPWRLWRRARPANAPRVGPLLAAVILTALLNTACKLTCFHLVLLAGLGCSRFSWYSDALAAAAGETVVLLVAGFAVWLSLQVFQRTMGRSGIRQGQILRVVV